MRQRQNRKGQSTLEYAIIIVVVVAGILAMQIFMKRSVQGKFRESTDDIGGQFEANATGFVRDRAHTGVTTQDVAAGVTDTVVSADAQTEWGTETVAAW